MATRRGRAAWPAAAAVVALLACALLPLGARGGCVVRLQLQPNNSTFSMTGANTLVLPTGSRIPGAVTEDPTQVKGMNGALYMMSDITACPTTVEAWRAALTSFNLTSQTSSFEYTPIKIYPTTLLASTIGFRCGDIVGGGGRRELSGRTALLAPKLPRDSSDQCCCLLPSGTNRATSTST